MKPQPDPLAAKRADAAKAAVLADLILEAQASELRGRGVLDAGSGDREAVLRDVARLHPDTVDQLIAEYEKRQSGLVW